MLRDEFNRDLENAKIAERIVCDTFSKLSKNYRFLNVAANKEYYYKGDIKAIAPDGREIFIEVKNDSRIAETRNVLCEETVYYKERECFGNGNMYCDC